ncbi:GPR1/FUN34/yaaH family-domain-containing protein [Scheffersomyces coipomensis]|uniref:GPR1/FUN34/yaaH family-domain-containing protein n=1 Tax=Scheffersomyces coipomensis TaxID=1788519 RepID=UPI00315D6134
MSSIDSPTISKTNASLNSNPIGSNPYKTITYSGDGNEYVIIDNHKYLRHELMQAFGGTLNPGLSPPPVHQFGNASALGLASFSVTTFVLALYLIGAKGIAIPNVVVSLCFFYGGAVEMLAGIWELVIGNTFAGTVFTSFGTFWIAYGSIFVEAFGIQAAYADEPEQFGNAVGFFILGWAIFTFLLLTCTIKATVGLAGLFLTLDIAFFLLSAANMTGNATATKAGGAFALISSIFGFYNMYAGIANETNVYIMPLPLQLPVYEKNKH